MRSFWGKLTAATAAAVCVGVVGAAATSTTTVRLAQRNIGKILVTRQGFTLYAFTRDTRNHDKCVAVQGCAATWPLLKKNGGIIAGSGVKRALLGSISLPHGVRQVTYAGHPLYTYSADSPGATDYVGVAEFGGRWEAVTSSGKLFK
jgi:predicted lipoprotein with Yx(FWY)xxD motif